MTGTVVRVRGIKRYRAKSGEWYCYHRATGKRISEEFGSAEFFTRLATLDDETKTKEELAAKPGTLSALLLDYKRTDAYKDLAPRTRQDYEKVFAFLKPLWNAPVSAFTTAQLSQLRTKWRETRGRRFVNYIRSVLSVVFVHGMDIGVMGSNPTRDLKRIKRPRNAPDMNRPWSLAERKTVLDQLPPHLRLPVAIGLYTGMREGDVLKLPRNVVTNGNINIKTSKRLVRIDLKVLPELRVALEAAPHHDAITLCANSRGKPWTENGFRCSLFKALKKLEEAGLVEQHLTFHGLRHTVATVLAEAGVSAEDIAAVLGQKSSKMAEHYAKEADRSRRSAAAIKKFKPLAKRAM